ncbi:hypothetical protein [Marinoscillum sp. 108]|uniref:hypothetical protein n=1 Tax=Marinoscillum sp. 108 TaxID=2653151 RepID=UPI0012F155F7|nr:hypothetical protein [Marinoscillum sp. 108]VXD13312.1 conserved hypothetical protein [Marinoscillum sp. 108]
MKKYFTVKNILLVISILLNIVLTGILGIRAMNEPTHKRGILTENIKVGLFSNPNVLFELPKGLTVEDASPRGIAAIDMFELERFSIVITSDLGNLVNYDADPSELQPFGNHYSADYPTMEKRK